MQQADILGPWSLSYSGVYIVPEYLLARREAKSNLRKDEGLPGSRSDGRLGNNRWCAADHHCAWQQILHERGKTVHHERSAVSPVPRGI